MKPILLATVASVALGAGAVFAVHASTKPPVYVVNEIDVIDPGAFKTYAEREGALIKSFGGRFLARGGETQVIAGEPARQRTTMYVFDDIDQANAWRDAPEQKELAAIRDKSSRFRSLAIEGCGECKPPMSR
jgi:uncharacterized protein (DUF1330 family)